MACKFGDFTPEDTPKVSNFKEKEFGLSYTYDMAEYDNADDMLLNTTSENDLFRH